MRMQVILGVTLLNAHSERGYKAPTHTHPHTHAPSPTPTHIHIANGKNHVQLRTYMCLVHKHCIKNQKTHMYIYVSQSLFLYGTARSTHCSYNAFECQDIAHLSEYLHSVLMGRLVYCHPQEAWPMVTDCMWLHRQHATCGCTIIMIPGNHYLDLIWYPLSRLSPFTMGAQASLGTSSLGSSDSRAPTHKHSL